jgi:hypothetical protein
MKAVVPVGRLRQLTEITTIPNQGLRNVFTGACQRRSVAG